MKEIKEKKLVEKEVTKYISDDGKVSSESYYLVDRYEQEQRRPYFEEYKKRLDELVNYVNENKSHLETCESTFYEFSRMVLFLLLRKEKANAYRIEKYDSDNSWKAGDF